MYRIASMYNLFYPIRLLHLNTSDRLIDIDTEVNTIYTGVINKLE